MYSLHMGVHPYHTTVEAMVRGMAQGAPFRAFSGCNPGPRNTPEAGGPGLDPPLGKPREPEPGNPIGPDPGAPTDPQLPEEPRPTRD